MLQSQHTLVVHLLGTENCVCGTLGAFVLPKFQCGAILHLPEGIVVVLSLFLQTEPDSYF